ncbi:AAA-ATPase At5g40000, partial [Linum perenne]
DEFRGVKVWWHAAKVASHNNLQSSNYPDRRYYRLSFNKRHHQLITEDYLRHVVRVGKEIRLRNRQRKLYTNSPGHKWPSFKQTMWSHIPIEHPATFDTMAMDPSKKEEIIDDLITFSKSSICSIIVIEDIDCSLDLTGQRKKRCNLGFDEIEGLNLNSIEKEIVMAGRAKEGNKDNQDSRVTLSGLIVFTTNCVEKLDPALIRRGRMDKHIELSYCSFEAFRVLARNYLKVEDRPMFTEVEKLINEIEITPADVAENLMLKSPSDDAGKCLSKLIAAMEEVKAIKAQGNEEEDRSEKGIVSQKIATDLVDL